METLIGRLVTFSYRAKDGTESVRCVKVREVRQTLIGFDLLGGDDVGRGAYRSFLLHKVSDLKEIAQ